MESDWLYQALFTSLSISIHALRMESDDRDKQLEELKKLDISIHALRMESDRSN